MAPVAHLALPVLVHVMRSDPTEHCIPISQSPFQLPLHVQYVSAWPRSTQQLAWSHDLSGKYRGKGDPLGYMLSLTSSFCSIICPGHLSTAWLVSLVVFSCHNGLRVVTREVHRSSLRRLIRPAQDHFTFVTLLIISMTFVVSLTQLLVFLSFCVVLGILLSIAVLAAAMLSCTCLVLSKYAI